ncbi:MAG: ribosome maturation factor RimM [SAR324 cluster bacterium]
MALWSGLIDRDRFVCIGRVGGAHGMHGEIKVVPLTDAPERYGNLSALIVDTARGLRAFEVEKLRGAGGQWLMKLKGLAGRDAAEALKGGEVLIEPGQEEPLGENEYLADDLTGCEVVTMAGAPVGLVTGLMDAGTQQVLRVHPAAGGESGGEVLVPLAETIVKEVNLDRRIIRIDPPPGLLELNRP